MLLPRAARGPCVTKPEAGDKVFWPLCHDSSPVSAAPAFAVDVAIIGAGAAGLFAAGIAAQRGRRVLVLEHNRAIGAKILISGGGRCNFTNLLVEPKHFLSDNPHFCRSALAGYRPADFIALVRKHQIAFHEKTLGQLFCDAVGGAKLIVAMLRSEADAARIATGVEVRAIAKADRFRLETSIGAIESGSVIIASGGLSIPKLGASDFAFRIAAQFGLPVIAPRPALVPLTFDGELGGFFSAHAGVSLPVRAQAIGKGPAFAEGMVMTHRGLSGPAILQASSYWRAGEAIGLDLAPGAALAEGLAQAKAAYPAWRLGKALAQFLPERLAHSLAARAGKDAPLQHLRDSELAAFARDLQDWRLFPQGDEGYAKAEVTAGGVDTRALDQRSMMARAAPGLYFIGEAVDVTGWLGGYNFHWAWASGFAAGRAV